MLATILGKTYPNQLPWFLQGDLVNALIIARATITVVVIATVRVMYRVAAGAGYPPVGQQTRCILTSCHLLSARLGRQKLGLLQG